jgi:ABC-2 type transport system ATP-binding protein
MHDYVIITESLTKKYKNVLAVDNLHLQVKRGELFGLVGPDGAGKTTTIQMLCGILNPTSGYAAVLNFDTVKETDEIRGRIGYMSEGFSLYGKLTVEENIEFFAKLYQVPEKVCQERKKELLHFSRLTPFVTRPAEKLSGGMKKKLALCCTLIYSPEILFLDEPTLGVDPVSRREFWKIINDFRREGITIFVTTPYMDEAERCDRLALLYNGKIIECDTPSNLKNGLKSEMVDIKADPQHKALNLLKNADGILEAQIFGERIHIRFDCKLDGRKIVDHIFSADGIKLVDFRKITPSLEDVFVLAIQEKNKSAVSHKGIKNHFVDTEKVTNNNGQKLAILLRNLTQKFGDFTAVNNLTMAVKEGQIFGFLGPNGSGKSTTIKILTGLLLPTSGSAEVGGFNIITEVEKMKSKIGYMSQKFSLYNDLTVEENINLYAGIYGITRDKLKERKKWVLDMADLIGKEKILTKSLSGGWKQRLALGCAILHEPSIIFLDEPTSGVDPIARRYFWDLIYKLSAQGVTVFVTTHYMDEAEHCHELGLIYNGNLIAQGSPHQLKKEKLAVELLEIKCSDPFEAVQILKNSGYQAAVYGSKIHVTLSNLEHEEKIKAMLVKNMFKIETIEVVPVSMEDLFVLLIEEYDRKNNKGG